MQSKFNEISAKRRSIYALGDNITISPDEIFDLVKKLRFAIHQVPLIVKLFVQSSSSVRIPIRSGTSLKRLSRILLRISLLFRRPRTRSQHSALVTERFFFLLTPKLFTNQRNNSQVMLITLRIGQNRPLVVPNKPFGPPLQNIILVLVCNTIIH